MLFWLTAVLLTLAGCAAVLLPVLRASAVRSIGTEGDLEMYRDQLAEVDRDAARGLIGAAEAEQARAEIGRRILRLQGDGEPQPTRSPKPQRLRLIALAAVAAVPLISWLAYGALGSPDLPAQPLQARLDKRPDESSAEELVARAEAHLAANPTDGRGWDVLAPIYVRMGRPQDAVAAYQNAIRLNGSSTEREAGFGEALTLAAGGIVSADAQAAFERALKLRPKDAKARYFLAVAKAQEGDYPSAIAAWQAMLSDLPAESLWRAATEQAIAEAERRMATEGGGSTSGPTSDDIEAASGLSVEERAEMIEQMVAQLDRKLTENPRDVEGWQRLLRSYAVLKRTEAAREALQRALQTFGPTSDEGRRLTEFGIALGIEAGDQ